MPKKSTLIKYLFLGFVVSVCGIVSTVAAEESLWKEAQKYGWKVKGTTQGKNFELMAIVNGRPIYYITCNADAAISTGAELLHNPPYSLDGNDLTIGLWDANGVLTTHQEFQDTGGSRVVIMDDSAPDSNHATHVAGTIGAQGIDAGAMGMAPAVYIDSYNWNSDALEMAERAATVSGKDGKIYLSNHSYGVIAGWEFGIFIAILGDFNNDDTVDNKDLAILTAAWLSTPASPNWNPKCDIAPAPDGDGIVNFLDYAVLMVHWRRAIPADFNGDGKVDNKDLTILNAAWLSTPASPNWNPKCDIAPAPNGDGIVNLLDYAELMSYWGAVSKVSVEELYWFGVWGELEDRKFGRYDSRAAVWDSLCYSAPYYLPFKAAGNDRDDGAPLNGTNFRYLDPNDPNELIDPSDPNTVVDPNGGRWVLAVYDDVNDPNALYDDGWDIGGYDTVPTIGTAKNIMTVGAVDDTWAMAGFSGWGPADDGRIKPDIVANGGTLYSPIAVSDANYDTYSGTGMASAAAAGSAALLVQYYGERFDGEAMRASTLKALIIHTAADLGNEGPDYRYGWGLMDVNQAADYIKQDADNPNGEMIIEDVLAAGTSNTYTFTSDGSRPIRATLCWTDPPGTPIVGSDDVNDVNDVVVDNNTPCLINDLDMRIIDNNDPNTIYYPYRLDPNNPDAAAVADANGNILDNVEQVYIPSPNVGIYTVEISHKGTLTNGSQYYSLILSEPRPIRYIFVDDDALNRPGRRQND